jgi:Tol biopolymer transport system component
VYPTSWPRDDLILYTTGKSAAGGDLMTVSPKPGATPRAYLKAPWPQGDATLSPDGKLVAFSAREDAQLNIWLRDFPTPVGKWKISPSAGNNPRWAPDGKSIYYVKLGTGLDTLMRVQVDRTPSVVPRAPVVATTILRGIADGPGNWDLHPDGKHFIVAAPDPSTVAPGVSDGSRFVVTLNWFTELRAATTAMKQ